MYKAIGMSHKLELYAGHIAYMYYGHETLYVLPMMNLNTLNYLHCVRGLMIILEPMSDELDQTRMTHFMQTCVKTFMNSIGMS